MIARLAGKIGDRAAGGSGGQSATADEVETQREKAAAGENEVADKGWNVDAVFE
jgi:hypothetical protein